MTISKTKKVIKKNQIKKVLKTEHKKAISVKINNKKSVQKVTLKSKKIKKTKKTIK